MSWFKCPWCGCECDYYLQREPKMPWGSAPKVDSPIQKMDYEKIESLCPSCKGTFVAIPKIERLGYDMQILEYWVDKDGNMVPDWDMESYDIYKLREKYLKQLGYGEAKGFSLSGGGFSLPPASDGFSLPPPQSKFSLSNLRRRRR